MFFFFGILFYLVITEKTLLNVNDNAPQEVTVNTPLFRCPLFNLTLLYCSIRLGWIYRPYIDFNETCEFLHWFILHM